MFAGTSYQDIIEWAQENPIPFNVAFEELEAMFYYQDRFLAYILYKFSDPPRSKAQPEKREKERRIELEEKANDGCRFDMLEKQFLYFYEEPHIGTDTLVLQYFNDNKLPSQHYSMFSAKTQNVTTPTKQSYFITLFFIFFLF